MDGCRWGMSPSDGEGDGAGDGEGDKAGAGTFAGENRTRPRATATATATTTTRATAARARTIATARARARARGSADRATGSFKCGPRGCASSRRTLVPARAGKPAARARPRPSSCRDDAGSPLRPIGAPQRGLASALGAAGGRGRGPVGAIPASAVGAATLQAKPRFRPPLRRAEAVVAAGAPEPDWRAGGAPAAGLGRGPPAPAAVVGGTPVCGRGPSPPGRIAP
jgi:hypothetical protein